MDGVTGWGTEVDLLAITCALAFLAWALCTPTRPTDPED